MITILVDEAYAFDYLSILFVKYNCTNNGKVFDQYVQCEKHLISQIGTNKFFEILQSNEYEDLVDANKETFDFVDLAKTDSCKASDVDRANFKRCEARKKLQEKFFGNTTTEVKFGYEVYK